MTQMTDIIKTVEQESEDLRLHVDLCAQRYHQLIAKVDTVEQRLTNIETMILEIRQVLSSTKSDTYQTYLKWSGVVIVALLGAVIHLVT